MISFIIVKICYKLKKLIDLMKYYKDLTIIIITFKSDEIIYKFIDNIPKKIKIIVVENSKNFELKKKLEKKYKNVQVYLRKNLGVSSSLNYAAKKTKTNYFLHLSPDLKVDYKDIKVFFKYAKKINDDFCALGPRFLNTKKKGHIQIDKKLKYGKIDSIHGSYMFINKKRFDEINGWDDKIFLYFEETDYSYRGKKLGLNSYQINSIKTKTIDTTVKINNENEKRNWLNLLVWHFIWSKFYTNKKKFGFIFSFIIFLPIIIRILFRLSLYSIFYDKKKLVKYKFRLSGLYNSIIGNNSYLRLKDIKN